MFQSLSGVFLNQEDVKLYFLDYEIIANLLLTRNEAGVDCAISEI